MHPEPTDEQINALLARHRLPQAPIELSPHEGSVNHVRLVGDVCLRILKEEDFASDLHTEAATVPKLREAGVKTPELLVFDDSRTIVPGIVTIYRRLPGIPLGESPELENPQELIREIGRQIALWQTNLQTFEDNRLDQPRHDNLQKTYERNAGRLSPEERTWTEALIRRLEQTEPQKTAFVHWDLHNFNILVHEGQLSGIVDWGDAGWGDPTLNYQRLPAAWLPLLLEPLQPDDNFVQRCLYGLLNYALNDVHRENRGLSPYAHRGHCRWESLQELLRTDFLRLWHV